MELKKADYKGKKYGKLLLAEIEMTVIYTSTLEWHL